MKPHPNWGMNELNIRETRREFKVNGLGVKVAILDTGVDIENENLNPGIIKTYDVLTGEPVKNDKSRSKHGTQVVGIIGARENQNNTEGVAPETDLYIVKVCSYENDLEASNLEQGICWAINEQVDIINISLKIGNCAEGVHKQIKRALDKGIIVVCGSGNSNDLCEIDSIEYPGAFQETLAIGATKPRRKDGKWEIYSPSDGGQLIDFAAPGYQLLSHVVPTRTKDDFSGTSYATAFVTGILALYLQAWQPNNKIKSSILFQIKRALIDSSDQDKLVCHDSRFGYGVINPYNLLKGRYTLQLNMNDTIVVNKLMELIGHQGNKSRDQLLKLHETYKRVQIIFD